MDERVTEMEVKLGFAEDLLDALNQTVYRQQEQIASLERQVRDLRDLIQRLPTESHSLRDEIPPHY